jgi:hypothetical protein
VRHVTLNTGHQHHFGAEILKRMDEGIAARKQ